VSGGPYIVRVEKPAGVGGACCARIWRGEPRCLHCPETARPVVVSVQAYVYSADYMLAVFELIGEGDDRSQREARKQLVSLGPDGGKVDLPGDRCVVVEKTTWLELMREARLDFGSTGTEDVIAALSPVQQAILRAHAEAMAEKYGQEGEHA